ncbi:DUF3157 family protein [Seonamhaeicola marinus]|uniref:DUF3157 family protein n=1 Tax=Seonamhaeicola marinus TaxID=1912246 RepID=A0A5D0HRE1_9FLAO|nr:DUF3157 family protein [Seonamhaeicola marinus]TYA73933.1 DUF3157 family protein [Seonamhaeicola marinus]
MKSLLIVAVFFISFSALSQNNHIVKTDDGRRVLLKADFTWEYIDLVLPNKEVTEEKPLLSGSNACNLSDDFEEPKLNKKIQSQLKKGRATIAHVKKKVAKEYSCDVDQVTLIWVKETLKTATYNFCANGKRTTYKRTGHVVAKKLKI